MSLGGFIGYCVGGYYSSRTGEDLLSPSPANKPSFNKNSPSSGIVLNTEIPKGRMMYESLLSPGELKTAISDSPLDDSKAILDGYLNRVATKSPEELASFIATFDPNELTIAQVELVVDCELFITSKALEPWLLRLNPKHREGLLNKKAYGMLSNGHSAEALSRIAISDAKENSGIDHFLIAKAAEHLASGEGQFAGVIESIATLPEKYRKFGVMAAWRGRANQITLTNTGDLNGLLNDAPSDQRGALLHSLATRFGGEDVNAALSTLSSISDPVERLSASLSALGASKLPAKEMAEYFMEVSANAGPESDKEVSAVAEKCAVETAKSSVEDAQRWCGSLKDGEIKNNATVALVDYWAKYDPVAASEWVSDMPKGIVRDRAAFSIVKSGRDDPERALANVSSIADPGIRASAIKSVVDSWRIVDLEYTSRLIQASGLSSDEKAAFTVQQK